MAHGIRSISMQAILSVLMGWLGLAVVFFSGPFGAIWPVFG